MAHPVFLFLGMNIKRGLLIVILLIAAFLAGYFLFRESLLRIALQKIQERLAKSEINFFIDSAGFKGITGIYAEGVSLSPASGDTLISFKKASATLSMLQLLKGNLPFDDIKVEDGFIHLVERADSTNNFSQLTGSGYSASSDTLPTEKNVDFKSRFKKMWRYFSRLTGFSDFEIGNFEILWTAPDYAEVLKIEKLHLQNSSFTIEAAVDYNGLINPFHLQGTLKPGSGLISFFGNSANGKVIRIPFAYKIARLEMFATAINGTINVTGESDSEILLNFNVAASQPGINHWRIGPENIIIDSTSVNLNMALSKTAIRILNGSYMVVNRLPINFESTFSKTDSTVLTLNTGFENVDSEVFFHSLPKGLFSTLDGIKTEGQLSYQLYFHVNIDQPDSLVFDSEMKQNNVKIISYGSENFGIINTDFTYEIREQDRIVRNIRVGFENPFFTPLENISPLLINSVMIAEDGTFYFHKGFNAESFRKSMATNIRERRFARGGSTITMQLVKNVFLNRNKTISRKVEEAIIVWLIENERIVSKNRMLEVYLNIIEWGPGVYGIGEAADFYFSKKPGQLNLPESIYLSSIIPRPKYFKYSFNDDGELREYLRNYFDVVAARLVKKEIITQIEMDSISYKVELKGKALNIVVPVDSIPADSIFIDNAGEVF